MKKIILTLFFSSSFSLFSQNTGSINVRLNDAETKEAIPFANIVLRTDSADKMINISVTTSNMDGECLFTNIPLGNYKVFGVYVEYRQKLIPGVSVKKDSITYVDLV